ncbi:MAG: hypothetical protein IKQ80_06270 [Clostridia bacterium]|nr:hypothetical protein [Clostridia bacterium]
MARNKRTAALPEGDDGRTIVDMNVEGMPWYAPKRPGPAGEGGAERPESRMTRAENLMFTWGALKAALLVVGVMCAGMALFVLFCQFVWFK